jgi:hypothetical protein
MVSTNVIFIYSGGLCALSGVFILTLPIPIVVNSFAQYYKNRLVPLHSLLIEVNSSPVLEEVRKCQQILTYSQR